jgi:hypothetical protein
MVQTATDCDTAKKFVDDVDLGDLVSAVFENLYEEDFHQFVKRDVHNAFIAASLRFARSSYLFSYAKDSAHARYA